MLPSKATVKAIAFFFITLAAAAIIHSILLSPWQFAAVVAVTAIGTGVLFFAGVDDEEDPNREEPGDLE